MMSDPDLFFIFGRVESGFSFRGLDPGNFHPDPRSCFIYCMFNKSCALLYALKIGQDVLDKQYERVCTIAMFVYMEWQVLLYLHMSMSRTQLESPLEIPKLIN